MYTVASALTLALMPLDWYGTHLNLVLVLTLMLNDAIETNAFRSVINTSQR